MHLATDQEHPHDTAAVQRPVPLHRQQRAVGSGGGNSAQGRDGSLQRILGWQPKINLEQGLRLTYDYFREKVAESGAPR